MTNIPKRLSEPFDPAIVSFRVGPTSQDKKKGMALAYIDARDVMRRLDEVCGPENWQDEYPWSDGKRVVCRLGIRIGDEWIWKTDGAGDTDMEGEKGALSDAFKRSAVKWGIGRYLYDTEAPWVAIQQAGRSYTIVESELPKLRRMLSRPSSIAGPEPLPPRAPVTEDNGDNQGEKLKAAEAGGRIRGALQNANKLSTINSIIEWNTKDLELIKKHYPLGYDDLMKLKQTREDEFRLGAD